MSMRCNIALGALTGALSRTSSSRIESEDSISGQSWPIRARKRTLRLGEFASTATLRFPFHSQGPIEPRVALVFSSLYNFDRPLEYLVRPFSAQQPLSEHLPHLLASLSLAL
jgi:hypothetical protein